LTGCQGSRKRSLNYFYYTQNGVACQAFCPSQTLKPLIKLESVVIFLSQAACPLLTLDEQSKVFSPTRPGTSGALEARGMVVVIFLAPECAVAVLCIGTGELQARPTACNSGAVTGHYAKVLSAQEVRDMTTNTLAVSA